MGSSGAQSPGEAPFCEGIPNLKQYSVASETGFQFPLLTLVQPPPFGHAEEIPFADTAIAATDSSASTSTKAKYFFIVLSPFLRNDYVYSGKPQD
jgi:hypothetical protein